MWLGGGRHQTGVKVVARVKSQTLEGKTRPTTFWGKSLVSLVVPTLRCLRVEHLLPVILILDQERGPGKRSNDGQPRVIGVRDIFYLTTPPVFATKKHCVFKVIFAILHCTVNPPQRRQFRCRELDGLKPLVERHSSSSLNCCGSIPGCHIPNYPKSLASAATASLNSVRNWKRWASWMSSRRLSRRLER